MRVFSCCCCVVVFHKHAYKNTRLLKFRQLSPDTNQWLGGIYLAVLAGIYLWHIGEWWKTRQMVCLIVWAGFHLSAVSNLFVCICERLHTVCENHF